PVLPRNPVPIHQPFYACAVRSLEQETRTPALSGPAVSTSKAPVQSFEPHFRSRILGIVSSVTSEQFLGLLADHFRERDFYLNKLVAANAAGSQARRSALPQTKPLPGLSARRNPK